MSDTSDALDNLSNKITALTEQGDIILDRGAGYVSAAEGSANAAALSSATAVDAKNDAVDAKEAAENAADRAEAAGSEPGVYVQTVAALATDPRALALGSGDVVQVTQDPDVEKIGQWRKDGAEGSVGPWTQISQATTAGAYTKAKAAEELSNAIDAALASVINEMSQEANDLTDSVTVALAGHEAVLTDLAGGGIDEVLTVLSERRRPADQPLYSSAGGLHAPKAASKTILFWIWGQSLAFGATSGPLQWTAALYPPGLGRAWMPRGGVHTYGQVVDMVPLNEGVFLGSIYDTVASTTIYHLLRDLDAILPGSDVQFAAVVAALGSQALYQLARGSVPYQQGLNAIRAIVEIEAARGRGVEVHPLCVQAENDVNARGNYFDLQMSRLHREMSEDIRAATGQLADPVSFWMQVNGVLPGSSPTGLGASSGQRLQNAQLRAALTHHGIRLIGPHYHCQGSSVDIIHKSGLGETRMGQMAARAILAELFGVGWRPMHIMDAYFATPPGGVAARILAEVHVPAEPMVIDTSGTVVNVGGMCAAPGYGIDVYSDAGTRLSISQVSILRASTDTNNCRPPALAIDLAAAPNSPTVLLTVAGRRDDGTDTSLGSTGTFARSLIRDSAEHVSLLDGALERNWLCHQYLRIAA